MTGKMTMALASSVPNQYSSPDRKSPLEHEARRAGADEGARGRRAAADGEEKHDRLRPAQALVIHGKASEEQIADGGFDQICSGHPQGRAE